VELCIGVAYLHRAMQRQADNRHILILQGMTFIFQYYRLYKERSHRYTGGISASMRQAAEYNVGRAFHQLGLLSLAVKYYERALMVDVSGFEKRDLKFEAAHNLGLIYAFSGNYKAARELTEKYLVL
jgi:general transcription factor 3C polypeptide 3 (transcription factor C subunit 4)